MTSIQVIIIGSNTYGHLGILEPFTYIEWRENATFEYGTSSTIRKVCGLYHILFLQYKLSCDTHDNAFQIIVNMQQVGVHLRKQHM